ncbi:MAG: Fur family transcriptional regulator, partial [Spirochaetota bacterium]
IMIIIIIVIDRILFFCTIWLYCGRLTMTTHIEKLDQFVKDRQLKKSTQRNNILSLMIAENKHLTVDEIYSRVKIKNPEIGIATVYRTIHLLCDAGIANELYIDSATTRYEITSAEHPDHLICTVCGLFIELCSEAIEKEQHNMAKKHGFILTDHRLMLFGICPSCRKKADSGRKK